MRKLGTLTIGQAPRADITPILDAVLGPDLPRRHAGVLDGLGADAIARDFAPVPGQPLLVTKLLDGGSVVLDRARTEAAARHKLDMLEDEGCTTILMLCTGHFASLTTRVARLVEPDRILPPTVAALIGDARLGIVVPLPEQIASEAGKWAPLARAPHHAAASPYDGAPGAVAAAARDLAARGAEVLLMDCMGFVEAHRREAAEAGLPVILSNSLVAKLVSELV